jgi:hypothetical protein
MYDRYLDSHGRYLLQICPLHENVELKIFVTKSIESSRSFIKMIQNKLYMTSDIFSGRIKSFRIK